MASLPPSNRLFMEKIISPASDMRNQIYAHSNWTFSVFFFSLSFSPFLKNGLRRVVYKKREASLWLVVKQVPPVRKGNWARPSIAWHLKSIKTSPPPPFLPLPPIFFLHKVGQELKEFLHRRRWMRKRKEKNKESGLQKTDSIQELVDFQWPGRRCHKERERENGGMNSQISLYVKSTTNNCFWMLSSDTRRKNPCFLHDWDKKQGDIFLCRVTSTSYPFFLN